jgi:hypothetical protein
MKVKVRGAIHRLALQSRYVVVIDIVRPRVEDVEDVERNAKLA